MGKRQNVTLILNGQSVLSIVIQALHLDTIPPARLNPSSQAYGEVPSPGSSSHTELAGCKPGQQINTSCILLAGLHPEGSQPATGIRNKAGLPEGEGSFSLRSPPLPDIELVEMPGRGGRGVRALLKSPDSPNPVREALRVAALAATEETLEPRRASKALRRAPIVSISETADSALMQICIHQMQLIFRW